MLVQRLPTTNAALQTKYQLLPKSLRTTAELLVLCPKQSSALRLLAPCHIQSSADPPLHGRDPGTDAAHTIIAAATVLLQLLHAVFSQLGVGCQPRLQDALPGGALLAVIERRRLRHLQQRPADVDNAAHLPTWSCDLCRVNMPFQQKALLAEPFEKRDA
jgi:hypothetical protein